ncbi:fic family toxin-antitoxin system, toxin component [Streptomyces sp. KL116D]|uniref:fic family toxin-antitoxin system, toxin component n=1 Tax=Streptomyces sp. KL116D TaxID=3045152 RepID=UPI003557892D
MELHIDVPWILQVAELAGAGDPAPDDYGVPVAAVAAHRGELLGQPVYDGPYARAAALVHILGRCRWLEHSNLAVAAATGVMYLEASGITVKPTREDATALRDLLLDPAGCGAGRIAALLRAWPTTT